MQIINPILESSLSKSEKIISEKVLEGERLSFEDAMELYHSRNIPFLGVLADLAKRKHSSNKVYFNRNFHIEPTNICVYKCKFCSYRRSLGEDGVWDYSIEDMLDICRKYEGTGVTEVHIVGGVHPKRDLHFFGNLISEIKKIIPNAHIKGFTAVELDYMIRKANMDLSSGLKLLKEYGLDSIPGGGAEIFDEEIRKQVCGEKTDSNLWLDVHRTAHLVGLPSNATMLYGHIEQYEHRVDHLLRLRNLQDDTKGFNAFIPLKYKSMNNSLGHLGEINLMEVLKNYAVCRLFLDNIPHIKAYWPMLGKEVAQLALSFGADDLDGTIDDSTKIYSMAGSEETKPTMSVDEIEKLVSQVGYIAVERDSLYHEISKK